jgi:hypothetical protein
MKNEKRERRKLRKHQHETSVVIKQTRKENWTSFLARIILLYALARNGIGDRVSAYLQESGPS